MFFFSKKTVTDVKAKWPMPSLKTIPLARVENIDFTTNSQMLSRGSRQSSSSATDNQQQQQIEQKQAFTTAELKHIIQSCIDSGSVPVLAKIVSPFSDQFVVRPSPPVVMINEADKVRHLMLANLYDPNCETLQLAELKQKKCGSDFKISRDECVIINDATKASPDEWRFFRLGRVTGSTFKSCVKTNIDNPSKTVIKNICYPQKMDFFSAATEYGKKNERIALSASIARLKSEHQNFKSNDCGLVICTDISYFASTPDALCSCDCCGTGVMEIKCPYKLKDGGSILNVKMTDPYVVKNDGKPTLIKTHQYYYQVQMEMFCTETNYCYFCVWSKSELIIINISRDYDFIVENLTRAEDFFLNVILPELIGKFFSRSIPNFFKNSY